MYLRTTQEEGSYRILQVLVRSFEKNPQRVTKIPLCGRGRICLSCWVNTLKVTGKAPAVDLNSLGNTKAPERCDGYPRSGYLGAPRLYTRISLNERETKKKDRNRAHDLPNTGRAFYPLSYENSWRSKSFNWVHVWQASCILLGSTQSESSWV